jgi:hypothetical protein
MNMTFGLGFLLGSGFINSNSVSSAAAGIPANIAEHTLTHIHVIFREEIFMSK